MEIGNGEQIIAAFGLEAGVVIIGLLIALGVVIREWRKREGMHEKRQEKMYLEYVAMSQAMIKTDNDTIKVLEALEQKIDDGEGIRLAIVNFLTKRLEKESDD